MAVVGFRRRTELRWGAGAARGGAAHHALAAGAAQLDRVAACGRAQADGRRLDQRAQRHARGREQRVVARGAQLQPQRARRQVRQQRGVHGHHVLHGCVERGPAPAAASRLPGLPHAPPGAAAAPASRCSAPHDRRAGRSASADRGGDVRCRGAPRAMAGRRAQRVVLEEVERHVRVTAFARRVGRAAGQLGARDVHLQDVLVVRQVLAAVLPARRRLGRPLAQARPACCGRALCCMGPGMARAVCRLNAHACPVIGSCPLGHGAPDAPRAAARPAQRLSRRRRARAGCRGATRAGCATRAAARPARRAPPPAAPCAARGARRVMAMPAAAPPAARRRPMRLRSRNPARRAARPRAPTCSAPARGPGRRPRAGASSRVAPRAARCSSAASSRHSASSCPPPALAGAAVGSVHLRRRGRMSPGGPASGRGQAWQAAAQTRCPRSPGARRACTARAARRPPPGPRAAARPRPPRSRRAPRPPPGARPWPARGGRGGSMQTVRPGGGHGGPRRGAPTGGSPLGAAARAGRLRRHRRQRWWPWPRRLGSGYPKLSCRRRASPPPRPARPPAPQTPAPAARRPRAPAARAHSAPLRAPRKRVRPCGTGSRHGPGAPRAAALPIAGC